MSEPNVGNVFDNLALKWLAFPLLLGHKGFLKLIHRQIGPLRNLKVGLNLLKNMLPLLTLQKTIAFQYSTGCVSDFIQRYMCDHAEATWAQMKLKLSARFAGVNEYAYALMFNVYG